MFQRFLIFSLIASISAATKYPIGFIVDQDATDIRSSFREIAEEFSSARDPGMMLDLITEIVDQQNALQYITSFCTLQKNGVMSMFGTLSMNSEPLVDEYTSTFQMPFVTVSEAYGSKYHRQKIRMLPNIAPALKQLFMTKLNWVQAYYFYNSNEGLYRYSRMAAELQTTDIHMDMRVIRVKDSKEAFDKFDMLLEVERYKLLSTPIELKIILDLGPQNNVEVLTKTYAKQAQKQFFHFLVGDLETPAVINWANFSGGGMNITSLRLVDFSTNTLKLKDLDLTAAIRKDIQAGFITVRKALTIDSFKVMKNAFADLRSKYPSLDQQIRHDNNFNSDGSRGIACEAEPITPWEYGNVVSDFLKNVTMDGLSGPIEFDEFGFRKRYILDVIEVAKKQMPQHIGEFTSMNNSLVIYETPRTVLRNITDLGQDRIRIISTHLGAPYTFWKPGRENKKDFTNDDFDGYIVEFVKEVMKELNITYKLVPVKDGGYGSPQADGSWDGMVGEIIRGEADMAIADLTINSDRENVIYFSKPFLRLGISIMIKKPKKQEANKYSFVDPLAYEVWMCVGFAYIGVSVVLFLVGRFSPYEWHIDTSGAEASMKNEFSVWNSLWFVFSTLMQQGCEVAPRAISSRIVASVWYLFTLIIISSYTANLAAFLTAARMNSPINSVEDLAKQTAIKYGTLRGGSTATFFRKSTYTVYKKMWGYMQRNPDVYEDSNEMGVSRVRESNGRYSYLIESTNNEYISNREPCDTMKVGANLNSQGYGIGMPMDSDLKSKINIAILKLRELQTLSRLEKKWWKEVGNICKAENKDDGSTSRLTVDKIEGIFHILAAGMGAGIVIVVFELLFTAKLDAVKSDGAVSFMESLKSHLSLFVNGDNEQPEGKKQENSQPDTKISEESNGADQKKTRNKFLSVDDVFTPPPGSPAKERQRLSPPTVRRSRLKNSASANSSAALIDNNHDRMSTGSTPAPPEQFRGGSGKPKINGNQTSV